MPDEVGVGHQAPDALDLARAVLAGDDRLARRLDREVVTAADPVQAALKVVE